MIRGKWILNLRSRALWWLHFFLLWRTIDAQIRYTIPEETKEGSLVGNVAKDLGLGVGEISARNLHIAAESGKQYFRLDLLNGELAVSGAIDRESLCGQSPSCVLPVQAVIENPLQLYRVEVEILDINDNAPRFLSDEHVLEIAESVTPGTRFPLESAEDPDVGSNSLRSYSINSNDCFRLNVKSLENGRKVPELILDRALDREKQPIHRLVLTALDGGNPAKSGTTVVRVAVQDINDNAPQFERTLYKTSVSENAGAETAVLTLTATDLDEGANSEIQYYFGTHTSDTILKKFRVDPDTGEISVTGKLDYEEKTSYTFDVRAKDRGSPGLEGHSSVQVDIVDENDNPPEVILTSLPSPVLENASVGTVIALINVRDLDSGSNGKLNLELAQGSPFKLQPSFDNHYSLVTAQTLDREVAPEYNVDITASDFGSPPLLTKKTVSVTVLDVNDNIPAFSQPSYNVYVTENNPAGSSIGSVSASDVDVGKNSLLSYSIVDSALDGLATKSYFYINSENGTIYSMASFDYEQNKVFHIVVQAKDHGSPSLSSNVTVHVFVLDQNDNVPAVIYPFAVMGSTSHQKMPRSAKAGHLVTKVTAVDADSGHNAWVSYRLLEATDASLFGVNLYTGEVRTKRAVSEQDDSSQRLLIEIKDNGEPVQSATVTVGISLEDGLHEPMLDFRHKSHKATSENNKITFYMIVSLASVSAVSFLTFAILVVRCLRSSSRNRACCCAKRGDSDEDSHPNRNLHIQLNTDGPIKYVEVLGGDMLSQSQSFRSCLSPVSEFSDFTFVKPSSTTDFKEMINVLDASLPDSAWTFESQQVSTSTKFSIFLILFSTSFLFVTQGVRRISKKNGELPRAKYTSRAF